MCFTESKEIINNKYKSLTPIVMKYISTQALFYSKASKSFGGIAGIDTGVLALP